jgi:hypothetical protein
VPVSTTYSTNIGHMRIHGYCSFKYIIGIIDVMEGTTKYNSIIIRMYASNKTDTKYAVYT